MKKIKASNVQSVIEAVVDAVAKHYGVTDDYIYTNTREPQRVEFRWMSWVIVKQLLPDITLQVLVNAFDLANHTTALHGLRKMTDNIITFPEYNKHYAAIMNNLEFCIEVDMNLHQLKWGIMEWRHYAIFQQNKLSK